MKIALKIAKPNLIQSGFSKVIGQIQLSHCNFLFENNC